MNIKPIRNQVLVRPFPSDDKSTGGIVVPESFRARNNRGEVVAVGEGTKKRPMIVKEGQVVYNVFEYGLPININGVIHYLMDQNALLCTE